MKLTRTLLCGLALASLCACGGGGGGLFGNNPIFNGGGANECSTGTIQELANPQANTYAPNTSSITIVASGNNNYLYSSYQNWYVYLLSNTGQQIQGTPLTLVSDPSGPHPYSSDFYYNSSLQGGLPSGETWTAYLAQTNNGCSAIPLQSFST